ncbi:hypothetical protein Poli38472_013301 [Pythium oligandrum]|uniref:Uncharacterized protein n=1 Tax=Pythium oligandrum TaxID=41045 RepID=A0A8K1F9N5_PYTOL|nr:hypothetical protein Poli38472_013301 [Pythium oligandrum]|eukprot:TMW55410.1 hypothetical protein Poli38472_013301 [Pythium oligandrum]
MDDAAPHKCSITLQIDAAVEDDAFNAPSFRFRFVEGSKKQTPTIGSAGWQPLADADQGSFRFEQVFSDVLVTEAFARTMDEDPIVSFMLSDQHAGATGAQSTTANAKASGGKNAPAVPQVDTPLTPSLTSRKSNTTGRGKLIADIFEVDVSSLLSGRLLVEQTWRSNENTHPAAQDPETSSTNSDEEEEESLFARLTRPAGKTIASTSASRSLFTSASGIRFLTIRVLVDKPLLSVGLHRKLNPLTLTIGTIRRLPGIAYQRSASGASPHDALVNSCRPVYALMHFFPDRRLYGPDTHSQSNQTDKKRLVLTSGQSPSATINWNHSVTFLCGRCAPLELYDAFQASTLTLEIHDRDLFQPSVITKLQNKWESLNTTGIDPTAVVPQAGANGEPVSTPSRATSPRTGAQQPQIKPLDAFAVDEIARNDWQTVLTRANECFAFSTASFRLEEVLHKAKAMTSLPPINSPASPSNAKPYMSLKLTSSVLANKRRARPIGSTHGASVFTSEENTADLSALDKLVREPGAFATSDTTLSLCVTLAHPIAAPAASNAASSTLETTALPLFSRMVLIFPYKDSSTLKQIMNAMEGVNLTALPGVPIRSYQMTDEEKRGCDSGTLDVITGVMVLDDIFRMVILEGLADGGMRTVYQELPRTRANDPESFRMFPNDQLRFTQRLYAPFEIDLKRIKLRYALPVLLTMPDIYMRTKVAENCFLALTRLQGMRRMSRLAEVKELDLFPTATMLLEVESKYGESISLQDIYGVTGKSRKIEETIEDPATNEPNGEEEEGTRTRPSAYGETRLKTPTDATNPEYEAFKRTRIPKDYLQERRQELEAEKRAYEQQKALQDAAQRDQPTGPVYMYSGQKLRTQDALQEELRKQLSKDKRGTYTYGPEFQSLAFSLVNPDELRQTEEREGRKLWTTQRGFIYPAPRPTSEYYKHRDAPSEARCEDLRQPFVDNINHPKPVSRDGSSPSNGRSRPEFVTLPSKDMVFGGTNGDGSANPDYFKSVHLCGEGLRREMEEALQKEQDEWERKLVVDRSQIKFLAHGNICSLPHQGKPSQLDKLTDILNAPVRSKPLRIVRNATLPSGKRVPLQAAPASILNQQEYVGCVASTFATTLRPTDATQFLSKHAASGKPADFHFPSTTDVLTPPVKKFTTYKGITTVPDHEKKSLLWRNPPV